MSSEQRRFNVTKLGTSPGRLTLIIFILFLGSVFYLFPNSTLPRQRNPADPDDQDLRAREDDWRSHPALAAPDGRSHRHGRVLVGDKIDDPRVLAELSRRFRATQELRFATMGDAWKLEGERDFEIRQEYFLRLLDFYWFSMDRLTGMPRHKIEAIFGPGGLDPSRKSGRLSWSAGRDVLIADIENNRVIGVQYVMGF
jgi:hypothetical protein